MLNKYFESQISLSHLRSGPAGSHLDSFAEWLGDQGYLRSSGRPYVRGANRFANWAQKRNLKIPDLDEATLELYRTHLSSHNRLRYSRGEYTRIYRGAQLFVAFLRMTEVLSTPTPTPLEPAQPQVVADFCHWMRTHRGVCERTLKQYRRVILALLKEIGSEQKLTATSIRDFVLASARTASVSKAKMTLKSLRAFLKFLIATNKCSPIVEHALPPIAEWSLSTLPRYLKPSEVKRVIDLCDHCTASGARSKAVVLLLARLGLRAGEVAALKLSDIHWKEGAIVITGKNRREACLPLPKAVGDAIKFYIENYRPTVQSDKLFISLQAPLVSICSSTISSIARSALIRAEIDSPSYGSHVFRHSAATGMLREGASLQAISTILRHESIEMTAHYAKIDGKLLNEVAMPWPEVESC